MVTPDYPIPETVIDPGDYAKTAAVVAFLEGPAANADGTVYFSDIQNDRIMRRRADGTLEVFRTEAGRADIVIRDVRTNREDSP